MTILEFLRMNGGYYRCHEIADGTGLDPAVVRERLRKMEEAGAVESRWYTPPRVRGVEMKPVKQYRVASR